MTNRWATTRQPLFLGRCLIVQAVKIAVQVQQQIAMQY
jgi:hypothetical protein